MFIYVGKAFTATIPGSRLKPVVCEKCATEFHYQLTRLGVGKASAPYYLGQNWAKRRAAKAAQRHLDKCLNRDSELVPCPNCRWVNFAAIKQYRGSKYRNWRLFALAVFFLGSVMEVLLYANYRDCFGGERSIFAPELCVVALVVLALTVIMNLVPWALRQRINPNRWSGDGPKVPSGTPPALIKDAAETGQSVLIAVPSDYSNLQTDAAWAIFRTGQLVLEPLCCQCLGPATVGYKLPMTPGNVLAVPLCKDCLWNMRRQWWIWNLIMLPIAFLLVWSIAGIPRMIDETGRTIVTILGGGLLALVGFVIIHERIQPYRLRLVDPDRGVAKIRFKNPAYTAILIRKIGQADGLYPIAPTQT